MKTDRISLRIARRRLPAHTLLFFSFLPFLLFFFFPPIVAAQSGTPAVPETEEEIERLLVEPDEGEEENQNLIDLLEYYRHHPLPLRSATVEELARLPGISPQAARRILDFLAAERPDSIERFADLKEADGGVLAALRLYTTLSEGDVTEGGTIFTLNVRSRLVQDLNRRRGYDAQLQRLVTRRDPATGDSLATDTVSLGPRYAGGSGGIFTRVLFEYGRYSGGITVEKDPGESLFYSDTLGFTYENFERLDPADARVGEVRSGLGAFVSIHGRIALKPATLYLGDYTAAFGQGLLFGESFAGRKGSAPTRDPYRSGGGLRSYRSGSESGYLRGVAAELNPGGFLPERLQASLFISRRNLDGSAQTIPTGEGDSLRIVTSIRNDGYLRTRTEIRGNDVVREEIAGLHADVQIGNGSIGITGYHSRYNVPVAGSLFDGVPTTGRSMGSIDATYDFPGARGFAEIAATDRGGVAAVAGAALELPRADVTIAARSYGTDFHSPHGTAFGESPANPRNEQGIYIGARARLFPRAFLSVYGDLYRIPEGNESVPFPVSGVDGMALFGYGATRDLDIGIRLRAERRGDAAAGTDQAGRTQKLAVDRTTAGGRFDATWRPKEKNVEVRFRLERKIAVYSDLLPASQGSLTYIDFRWRPLPSLALGSRLLLFDAESFRTQLYEFEQDVPGRLTSVPLNGEGGRFYLLARWSATPRLTLAARYGRTWYADRDVISPGSLQEIAGDTQEQLTLQGEWGM